MTNNRLTTALRLSLREKISPDKFRFFDRDDAAVSYLYNRLKQDWGILARGDQLPPDGDWTIWLMLGGRGAGKTRAGAEWVNRQAALGNKRIALVAPTYNDAREVMIEGESGLLSLGDVSDRPTYISSRRRLVWPNGSVANVFSAEDPDGLRGPQFNYAWADEFCAWAYPEDTLANLRFALRLGAAPRLVITTTPKPIPALQTLMKEPGVELTRAKTMDNAGNLSPAFMQAIRATYEGTRLGRQELDGEILGDHPGALWSRDLIEQSRINELPKCDKIIIALDPPVSTGEKADACGLIAVGVSGQGRDTIGYVLQDATLQGSSPDIWAGEAIKLWDQWGAEYVLAEANQGGDLIKTVFMALDMRVPVRTVYASKS